ncbi:MAG: OmpA family protein [Deltaproteobacteria bacterium]|nr:OmpA family protein [Deltaproteobacteria bacterium]
MKCSTLVPFSFALALVPLVGCGSSSTAQRYDDVVATRQHDYDIEPEGEVLAMCGLDNSRSYFAYDSSALSADDQALLGDVGRCLTSGRLQGRSILVTGYTDQEGTKNYNLELGLARSRAVATELAARGVPQTRIYLRSRGEDRAKGDSNAGRALDRKVELRVLARN